MECDLCFSAKDMKYRTWKFAISKCIAWQGTQFDSSFKDFVYEDKGMHDNIISPHTIYTNPQFIFHNF